MLLSGRHWKREPALNGFNINERILTVWTEPWFFTMCKWLQNFTWSLQRPRVNHKRNSKIAIGKIAFRKIHVSYFISKSTPSFLVLFLYRIQLWGYETSIGKAVLGRLAKIWWALSARSLKDFRPALDLLVTPHKHLCLQMAVQTLDHQEALHNRFPLTNTCINPYLVQHVSLLPSFYASETPSLLDHPSKTHFILNQHATGITVVHICVLALRECWCQQTAGKPLIGCCFDP